MTHAGHHFSSKEEAEAFYQRRLQEQRRQVETLAARLNRSKKAAGKFEPSAPPRYVAEDAARAQPPPTSPLRSPEAASAAHGSRLDLRPASLGRAYAATGRAMIAGRPAVDSRSLGEGRADRASPHRTAAALGSSQSPIGSWIPQGRGGLGEPAAVAQADARVRLRYDSAVQLEFQVEQAQIATHEEEAAQHMPNMSRGADRRQPLAETEERHVLTMMQHGRSQAAIRRTPEADSRSTRREPSRPRDYPGTSRTGSSGHRPNMQAHRSQAAYSISKPYKGSFDIAEIEQQLAATRIQASMRGRTARRELQRQHVAATRIQASIRGKSARYEMAERHLQSLRLHEEQEEQEEQQQRTQMEAQTASLAVRSPLHTLKSQRTLQAPSSPRPPPSHRLSHSSVSNETVEMLALEVTELKALLADRGHVGAVTDATVGRGKAVKKRGVSSASVAQEQDEETHVDGQDGDYEEAGVAAIIESGAAITVQAAYRGWAVRNVGTSPPTSAMHPPRMHANARGLVPTNDLSTAEVQRLARLEEGITEIKDLLLQQRRQQLQILKETQHHLLLKQEQQEPVRLLQSSPTRKAQEETHVGMQLAAEDIADGTTSARRRRFLLREGGGGGGSFMLTAPDDRREPSLPLDPLDGASSSIDLDADRGVTELQTGAAITLQAAYRGWHTRRGIDDRAVFSPSSTEQDGIVGTAAQAVSVAREHDLDCLASFVRYDMDGDGHLNESEVTAMLREHQPALPSDSAFVAAVMAAFCDGTADGTADGMTLSGFKDFWQHVGSRETFSPSGRWRHTIEPTSMSLVPDGVDVYQEQQVANELQQWHDSNSHGDIDVGPMGSAIAIQSEHSDQQEWLVPVDELPAASDHPEYAVNGPDAALGLAKDHKRQVAATAIQATYRSHALRRELYELVAMGMPPADIAVVLAHVLV